MCLKRKYRKSVFILIYSLNEGKISYLVLKRKLHWRGWEFPKAGVEKRESNIKAVIREINEETGLNPLKIKRHRKKGYWNYESSLKDRPGLIGQSWRLYSVLVNQTKVKIDKKEHSDFKWVDYKEAIRLLTHENQRECLVYFHNWLIKNIKSFSQ